MLYCSCSFKTSPFSFTSFFISLELYQDGRYTEHRIPIKALFASLKFFNRAHCLLYTHLFIISFVTGVLSRNDLDLTGPRRGRLYTTTQHTKIGRRLDIKPLFIISMAQGKHTFGCWRATHYDIWDMISGADHKILGSEQE